MTTKKATVTSDCNIQGPLTTAQQTLTASPLFQLSFGLYKTASQNGHATAKNRQEDLQKVLDQAGHGGPSMM